MKLAFSRIVLDMAATAFVCFGAASAQDPQPAAPVVITSANDPTKPVPGGVRWFGREHGKCMNITKAKNFDCCFLGDSITAMWPGDMFNRSFGKFKPANFGIGGDRCENVLWRLEQGELKDCAPKVIVLMIGTNNQGMNTAEEVAYGVATVVKKLQAVCPESKILVLGILPSKGATPEETAAKKEKTKAINVITAKLDDGKKIRYLDFGPKMLDEEGKIKGNMLTDAVHLTRQAYDIWAEAIMPLLTEMMGMAEKTE